MSKVLDRENSEMTLDAQGRGVFSLDITATDQALPNNIRKSSTVRVSQTFFAFSRKQLLQTKLNGPLILVSWFGYCLVNFCICYFQSSGT